MSKAPAPDPIRKRSPVHPGEVLGEALDDRHLTQTEFAERVGLSRKHVNRIVNGHALYRRSTAARFEEVLGITAAFWIALKRQYQLDAGLIRGRRRPPSALAVVMAGGLLLCGVCHLMPL